MVIIPESATILAIHKTARSIRFLLCVFRLRREIRAKKMTIISEKRLDHRRGAGSQGEKEKTIGPIVSSVPLVLNGIPGI